MSRSNEVLGDQAHRRQWAACISRPGLTRGEGGLSPAVLVAATPRATTPSSASKAPAFDLTDRGVAGRRDAGRLDAFVYTERGVYRSGETVHVTALLRDAQGVAALNVPLTLVVERPDGVEYRRVAGARSGPRRPFADRADHRRRPRPAPGACAPSPIRSARRSARPPSWSRTMCPTGLEFDLAAPAGKHCRATRRRSSRVDGRYLYGAPASALDLEGEIAIAAAKERPGLAGYQFGLSDEEVTTMRQDARRTCRRPTTRARRRSRSRSTRCRRRRVRWRRQVIVRHGGIRRPRGRAQAHAAGRRRRAR